MSWDRTLWGIEFTSGTDSKKMLIGTAWHERKQEPYAGEPTRALLFTTREAAREWCRPKQKQYAGLTGINDWRFRPVRVRETVNKV